MPSRTKEKVRYIKVLGKIALGILGILGLMGSISYVNHKVQLSKEKTLLKPNGTLVNVNDSVVHIYAEGQGKETLVFMSGGGTCSPALDFKTLYTLFSDEYRIVVIEKNGYGFSDISDSPRDIDTILKETRTALSEAGEVGPYILFPHSMAGIEAIYWAQKYPNEVKAIIGLDPAVPEAYEDFSINIGTLKLGAFGAKIGITRWFPSIVENSAAIKYGRLTEQEKELYRNIFYRRTATPPMLAEVKEIKNSARKVQESGVPNIPMLFFISNGEETGWESEEWKNFSKKYIEENSQGSYIQLDCSHYIHNIQYKKIANEAKKFLNK